MKVLLVDSNLITSLRIAGSLKSSGFEVIKGSSFENLKDVLKDIKFAVINLEAPEGIKVLENLKREFPEIKVVAFCGHKNIKLQEEAKKHGADIIVPNSVIVSQLPEIIKRLQP